MARVSTTGDKAVATGREQFRLSNEKNERILRPLIETILAACQEALLDLEHAHQLVADRSDLDLLGRSRRSARWLVTGRCIGFGHAAFDLARLGYTGEVVPIIRSMHETARLLSVLNLGGEDDLVTKWIAGRNVSRREIMAASDRQEQAIRTRMILDGVRPASPTKSQFDRHHGRWSEYAHPRRGPMTTQVSESARIMATGPHPDWCTRAVFTEHFGYALTEVISVGGHALASFLDRGWHDHSQATFRSLTALLESTALAARATPTSDSAGSHDS